MNKRFFLSAIMAIVMIGAMNAQNPMCAEDVTLESLTSYMDTMRTVDPSIKLFYINLVNNPTHSYRIEHLDLGFNGCTGRVDEHVVLANGNTRDNVFYFNEQGHLAKRIIIQPGNEKRTLIYQDGYIVREEVGGKAFRYHYDFDTATGKKFLIAIKELKGTDVVHERTFDYDIDTHGRYTRVSVALDGKHQMTITRSYSL